MDKKKAIKIVTASTIAASAFVTANPYAFEASTSVDAVVKNAKTAMKGAYLAYNEVVKTGKLVDVKVVQEAIKKADAEYKKAVAEVKKNGGKKKDALLADLDATYKTYVTNGAKKYVAAYPALTALSKVEKLVSDAIATKDLAKVKAAYDRLVSEVKKAQNATKAVYGSDARAAFVKSANATIASLQNDTTAYVALTKAQDALSKEDFATAQAMLDKAAASLEKATSLKAELTALNDTVKASFEEKAGAVKEVSAVADVTVNEGEKVTLPEKVEVTLKNGKKVEKAVTWESKDLTKPGEYTLNGTFEGTELKATVKVVVKEVAPKVESVSANNNANETVTLKGKVTGAEKVTVVVKDKDNKEVAKNENVEVKDGEFSFTTGVLKAGDYTYSVVAVKGDKSSEAKAGTVTVANVRPTIEKVEVLNAKQIKVTFSEEVNETEAIDTQNYTIVVKSNGTSKALTTDSTAVLSADKKSVTITLGSTDLTAFATSAGLLPVDYLLFVDNSSAAIKDLSGNTVVTNSNVAFTGTTAPDTQAPVIETVSFNKGTGVLTINFNEDVKLSDSDVNELGISFTNGTDSVALVDADYSGTANGRTVTITLSADTLTKVKALTGTLSVKLAAGAFKDLNDNSIAEVTKAVTLTAPPEVQSVAYNSVTDRLVVTFDKTVKLSSVDLTKFAITGKTSSGASVNQSLSSGTVIVTAADSNTLELIPTEAQREAIETIRTDAKLVLTAGAVQDTNSVNSVAQTVNATVSNEVPTIVSAEYDANTNKLKVKFSEKVDKDTVAGAKFTVYGDGASLGTLTGITVDELANSDTMTFTLTGSTDVTATEVESVSDKSTLKVFTNDTNAVLDEGDDAVAKGSAETATQITYKDTAALGFVSQSAHSKNQIKVKFDAKISKDSLNTATVKVFVDGTNKSVEVPVTSVELLSDEQTVFINTGSNLSSGVSYVVEVTGVKNKYGSTATDKLTTSAFSGSSVNGSAPVLVQPSLSALTGNVNAPLIDADGSQNISAGDKFKLVFDQPVKFDSTKTLSAADFALTGGVSPSLGSNFTVVPGEYANEVYVVLGSSPSLSLGTTTVDLASNDYIVSKNGVAATAVVAGDYALQLPTDATAAKIKSAVYNDANSNGVIDANDTLTVQFDKAINTSTLSNINHADLAFSSGPVTLSNPTLSGNDTLVFTITGVTTPFTVGTTTLDVAGSNDIINSWGVPAAGVAAADEVKITSNDKTAPTLVSAVYKDNGTPGNDTDDTIVLTFSESVNATTASIAIGQFAFANGLAPSAVTAVKTGDKEITLDITNASGMDITPGYTTIKIAGSANQYIKDASGNAAVATAPITITAGTADTTAPTVVSVTRVSATTVDVRFSEAVDQTTAEGAAYTISTAASGDTETFTSATLLSDGKTVRVVFSGANIVAGDDVTVPNTVEDLAGNTVTTATVDVSN
ncbi:hypothetical protein HNR63_000201 [Anoxybacillus kamchatkensis]|uniref:Ig-like domain-containing protein n=1 Tax=Anoxybacillus ayderensis TaxID=265546 RepID=UPI0015EB64F7|nr:Ig-like domain-containing protein [Anoxybacillus ayderensis]MBA2877174.1 hypothetical protein [Anoxybacillus ayderensis]